MSDGNFERMKLKDIAHEAAVLAAERARNKVEFKAPQAVPYHINVTVMIDGVSAEATLFRSSRNLESCEGEIATPS